MYFTIAIIEKKSFLIYLLEIILILNYQEILFMHIVEQYSDFKKIIQKIIKKFSYFIN